MSRRGRCRSPSEISAGITDRGPPGRAAAARSHQRQAYVLFYTTKRVGGGMQDFDAINVLKFAVN